jgi:hypothetical protein
MIVGIWGFGGDQKKALLRFERNPPDRLFVSFEQVIEYLRTPGTEELSEPATQLASGN